MGVTPDDGARDEPDVAALAGSPGIDHLSRRRQPFGNTRLGGTSAAAPMWAGVWALLEQGKGHTTITNSLEGLYTLGKAGKGFHDVTSGNNGGPGDTRPAATPRRPATTWRPAGALRTPPTLIANWQ